MLFCCLLFADPEWPPREIIFGSQPAGVRRGLDAPERLRCDRIGRLDCAVRFVPELLILVGYAVPVDCFVTVTRVRCRVWQVRHAVGGGASASAAGTPRTPRSAMATVNHLLLPHPQYVYAARCHPTVSSLVVTGCFDGAVRVWGFVRGADPRLSQPVVRASMLELLGDTTTCICTVQYFQISSSFKVGLLLTISESMNMRIPMSEYSIRTLIANSCYKRCSTSPAT